jgi:FtsZ-binding cell division protein ZapB
MATKATLKQLNASQSRKLQSLEEKVDQGIETIHELKGRIDTLQTKLQVFNGYQQAMREVLNAAFTRD